MNEEGNEAKEVETPPESKAKKGFMMSVDDIINPELDDKGEKAPDEGDFGVKDLVGDGAVGDIIGRFEDEEVRSLIDKDEPKAEEKDEPKAEEKEPELKVSREAPTPPPVPQPVYQPPKAPAPQPTTPPVSGEDQKFVDSLDDRQRAQIDFLKKAEKALPEKFKNASESTVKYLKGLAEHLEKFKKEDEYGDVEAEAAKYQSEHQPKFSEFDMEEARQEIVASKIRSEMEEKYDKRLRQLDIKPEVQKKVSSFRDNVYNRITTEPAKAISDIVESINTDGIETARDKFPEEVDVFMKTYDEHSKVGEALISLREGYESYDESNPLHVKAGEEVLKWEERMINHKDYESKKMRDGKVFLPVNQYAMLTPEQKASYWTFSTDQILEFIAGEAKHKAIKNVAEEQKRLADAAKRYAERHGLSLGNASDAESSVKDAREEAAESTSIEPTRSGGSDSKSSSKAEGKGKKMSFMMHGSR